MDVEFDVEVGVGGIVVKQSEAEEKREAEEAEKKRQCSTDLSILFVVFYFF